MTDGRISSDDEPGSFLGPGYDKSLALDSLPAPSEWQAGYNKAIERALEVVQLFKASTAANQDEKTFARAIEQSIELLKL